MLTEQQKQQLKDLYHNYFKDSALIITKGCLTDCEFIHCYLAGSAKECENGISHNDCFQVMFHLEHKADGYQLYAVQNWFTIKPTNKYCFCDYERVNFRRVDTQDFQKIIDALKRFFERLHKQVKANIEKDNLLGRESGQISDLELAKQHIVL